MDSGTRWRQPVDQQHLGLGARLPQGLARRVLRGMPPGTCAFGIGKLEQHQPGGLPGAFQDRGRPAAHDVASAIGRNRILRQLFIPLVGDGIADGDLHDDVGRQREPPWK
jgi:hypothetical protein